MCDQIATRLLILVLTTVIYNMHHDNRYPVEGRLCVTLLLSLW